MFPLRAARKKRMSDYEDQQRKKRLEDLENKRKRLEEMRKLKKDRTQVPSSSSSSNLLQASSGGASSTTGVTSGSSKRTIETINVDELVNSLLSPTTAANVGSPTNGESSQPSSSEQQPQQQQPVISSFTSNDIRQMKAKELVTVPNVVQVNIFPCISETYEKETQVNLDEFIDEKVIDSTQTPHRRMRSESIPPSIPRKFPLTLHHHPLTILDPDTPSSPIRQRAPSFTEVDPTTTSSSQEGKKSLTTEELQSLLVSHLPSLHIFV